MHVVSELASCSPQRETLLTIGVFDGVHLGHQHLIKKLTQKAITNNLLSGVVTFNRHPRTVLSPQAKLARLATLEERINLLEEFGVELVVPLTFTTELATLSARDFVSLLRQHLKMRGLMIGPGFALGRGREGDATALQTLGQELGFSVELVEPLKIDGSLVSSTIIREALSLGDMKTTSKLLGRHFRLGGPVVGGVERGRALGFPTANIEVGPEQALPIDGVYATLGYIGDSVYNSVTNIGVRPTFDDGGRMIEVFLMDFDGDVYGKKLAIELVERLRGEVKFADSRELVAQIERDVEQAKEILKQVVAGAECDG